MPTKTQRYDVCFFTISSLTDVSWFGNLGSFPLDLVGCFLGGCVVVVDVVEVVVVVIGIVVVLRGRGPGTQP